MTGSAGRRMVPAYVATGGRTRVDGYAFDRMTVLHSIADTLPAGLGAEHARLWELLRPGALTLVEVAAHLDLPVSATTFLAADLVDAEALGARPPVPDHVHADPALLERLLVGLRALR